MIFFIVALTITLKLIYDAFKTVYKKDVWLQVKSGPDYLYMAPYVRTIRKVSGHETLTHIPHYCVNNNGELEFKESYISHSAYEKVDPNLAEQLEAVYQKQMNKAKEAHDKKLFAKAKEQNEKMRTATKKFLAVNR